MCTSFASKSKRSITVGYDTRGNLPRNKQRGSSPLASDRLFGLVVKASASRSEDPGFESPLRRDFSGVESYQQLKKNGTQVATMPGAWRYSVSAETGRPGVSIL